MKILNEIIGRKDHGNLNSEQNKIFAIYKTVFNILTHSGNECWVTEVKCFFIRTSENCARGECHFD
jgi:hypothetical protein